MLFRVKKDARYSSYTALSGREFTKNTPTSVPDEMIESALKLEFLEPAELTDEVKVALGATEKEASEPEADEMEDKQPRSRGKSKKEG